MQTENVVTAYFDACNKGEVKSLQKLLTRDCVYCDVFFSDVVPYWDIPIYFEEEPISPRFHYTITNFLESNSTSARYEYNARIVDSKLNDHASYSGAEKLTLRGGKISRMTDWYNPPVELLSIYYGTGNADTDNVSKNSTSASHFTKILQCKSDLLRTMRTERLYALPNLSLSLLSEKIGHREELIASLLKLEFHCTVHEFVERYRVQRAREIIEQQIFFEAVPPGQNLDKCIADEVGFSSHASFIAAFRKVFDQSPRQWRRGLRLN